MALGAAPRRVRLRVVGEACFPVAIGLGLGLWGAFHVTELLQGLLYNVTPTDPMTFLSVAVVLSMVAILAAYAPARRASRVDPMTVLRSE
jgi:ABC-type antimicrobial peptide transport system permease subunit